VTYVPSWQLESAARLATDRGLLYRRERESESERKRDRPSYKMEREREKERERERERERMWPALHSIRGRCPLFQKL
jgi:hypothetical protein